LLPRSSCRHRTVNTRYVEDSEAFCFVPMLFVTWAILWKVILRFTSTFSFDLILLLSHSFLTCSHLGLILRYVEYFRPTSWLLFPDVASHDRYVSTFTRQGCVPAISDAEQIFCTRHQRHRRMLQSQWCCRPTLHKGINGFSLYFVRY